MNSIYDKNIAALKEFFPDELKQIVENYTIVDDIEVFAEEGYDGKIIPCVRKGDDTFQLDLIHDNSRYLDLWYEKLIHNAVVNVYVFYGLGNGMFARRLLKDADEKDVLLVYEPDAQIISKIIENFDLSDVFSDKRFAFVIGDFHRFNAILSTVVGYAILRTVNSCIYPNYENVYENEVRKIVSKIGNTYKDSVIIMNTFQHMARHWYFNALKNMKYLVKSKSFNDFSNKIDKNIPIIIVSSGPSLNKNIDLLNKAKGKSIIVSVDSALPALLKKDIIPDMFISVDALKQETHFNDPRVNNIASIGMLESIPSIYSHHKPNYIVPKFLTSYFSSIGAEYNKDNSLGCVSGCALLTFLRLGYNTIILIGQDLAFTDDKDHAEGVINDVTEDSVTLYCYVEDIYGGKVKSSELMAMYIRQFESVINGFKEQTVVDATEGGAKIDGTEIMTFTEAIDKYCNTPIDFIKEESNISTFLDENQQVQFIQFLNELEAKFDEIETDLSKAADTYMKLKKEVKGKYDPKTVKQIYNKTNIIAGRIAENPVRSFVELLNVDEARNMQGGINVLKDSEKEELIAAADYGITHAKSMLAAAKEAKEIYMQYKHTWNE